jgi:cyclophilin family peptidyl-prolyl cis-trans isomerase
VLRTPIFAIAAVILLAQLAPSGCPQEPAPPPPPLERGTIVTRASSSAAGPVAAGTPVSLSGAVDGDSAAAVFSWAQTQGPGVRLEGANSATASFSAPSFATEQTLRFRLSTSNAAGDVGSADVTVVIEADPNFGFDTGTGGGGGSGVSRPVARAGTDQTVEVATEVTLDGSSSTGRSLSFRWRQSSGPTVTLAAPDAATTTFDAPAVFEANDNQLVFELTVRDAAGQTARDTVVVRLRDRDTPDGGATRVRIDTTLGSFTLEMEDERSPMTVENFLRYVDENFYDNTIIHRVVSGFVIQGGGYSLGLVEKTTRDPVPSEASNGLTNVRATVSMALVGGDPNSGTSQFFVNLVDNTFLDDQNFTVFARVVEGMTVVDQIAGVQTTTRNGFENVPVTDVVVTDVVRLK